MPGPPLGGRIGSNEELGIEGSGHGDQLGRDDGRARWMAAIRVACGDVGFCKRGIAAGLFSKDARVSGAVGCVGARRTAGSESGEQGGTAAAVLTGIPRSDRARIGCGQGVRVSGDASAAAERWGSCATAVSAPRPIIAAGKAQAGVRGALTEGVSSPILDVDRAVSGGVPRGVPDLAMERVSGRLRTAAGYSS